ncbi:MAG: GFA family protein [Halioglobus sp.]
MSEKKGGCLCGKIRYTLSDDPAMVAACHCKNCQKQTGTAYSVLLGMAATSVSIDQGELKTYEDTGTSGMPVERKFCGDCGSPVLSKAKAIDGLLFIKGGTLDDTSGLTVGAEIWCDSRADWSTLGEDVAKMPGNPPAG